MPIMSPVRETSFTEAYRNKIKEIRDVVAGRKKMIEINFERDEDINLNYEKKIETLFETLQKKILQLNLSEVETLAKIPNEPTKKRNDVATTTTTSVDKQWYDGTNYTCKQCDKIVFGGLAFKRHLKTDHQVSSKDLINLLEFSSRHKELSYACLVCKETVDHQFKSIYDHLRKEHSLSIVEYESKYLKTPESPRIPKKAVSTAPVPDVNKFLKTPVVSLPRLKSSELEKYSFSIPCGSENSVKPRTVSSSSGSGNEATHTPKETESINKPSEGKIQRAENSKKRKSSEMKEAEKDEEIMVVYDGPVNTILPRWRSEPDEVPVNTKFTPSPPRRTEPFVNRKPRKIVQYFCPVEDPAKPGTSCPFFTQKDGFSNGEAAMHLSKVHGIKKQDMNPGDYKFKRVKTEI